MADNLKGIPISSLPKADELVADDQLIAYREDNGKAYRANVGTLGEAAESNLSDAFSTSKTYSAGDYVIYNDTLWKFTADKDAGEWDESVVEKTTMGTEIGEINQSLTDYPYFYKDNTGTLSTIRIKGADSSTTHFCVLVMMEGNNNSSNSGLVLLCSNSYVNIAGGLTTTYVQQAEWTITGSNAWNGFIIISNKKLEYSFE